MTKERALLAYLEARAKADSYDMNDRITMKGEWLREMQAALRDTSRAYLAAIQKEAEDDAQIIREMEKP